MTDFVSSTKLMKKMKIIIDLITMRLSISLTWRKQRLRLANMTHLYVVPTTNLFHLEGPSSGTEPRGLGINLPRSCAPGHEFRTISNIFNWSAYIGPRSRSIYHVCALLSVFRTHRTIQHVRNERRIYTDRPFGWNNGSKRGHIGLFR